MIRDGKLAELVKPVVLAGNLFKTLDRIDAVAGDFRWNQTGWRVREGWARSRFRSARALPTPAARGAGRGGDRMSLGPGGAA